VLIRDATVDDLSALRDVFRRASLTNVRDRDVLLAHPAALDYSDEWVVHGLTRVAVITDRVVGFATAVPDGDHAELEDLFVAPEQMRRGIARALIADAVERMRAAGVTRIDVTANEHAAAFYDAVGFLTTGAAETEFGPAPRLMLGIR
jgi:ribosomal protein S18 acetylase RimI-like enzyme